MPDKTEDNTAVIKSPKDCINSSTIWNDIVKTVQDSNINPDKLINDSIEYALNIGLFHQCNELAEPINSEKDSTIMDIQFNQMLTTVKQSQIPSVTTDEQLFPSDDDKISHSSSVIKNDQPPSQYIGNFSQNNYSIFENNHFMSQEGNKESNCHADTESEQMSSTNIEKHGHNDTNEFPCRGVPLHSHNVSKRDITLPTDIDFTCKDELKNIDIQPYISRVTESTQVLSPTSIKRSLSPNINKNDQILSKDLQLNSHNFSNIVEFPNQDVRLHSPSATENNQMLSPSSDNRSNIHSLIVNDQISTHANKLPHKDAWPHKVTGNYKVLSPNSENVLHRYSVIENDQISSTDFLTFSNISTHANQLLHEGALHNSSSVTVNNQMLSPNSDNQFHICCLIENDQISSKDKNSCSQNSTDVNELPHKTARPRSVTGKNQLLSQNRDNGTHMQDVIDNDQMSSTNILCLSHIYNHVNQLPHQNVLLRSVDINNQGLSTKSDNELRRHFVTGNDGIIITDMQSSNQNFTRVNDLPHEDSQPQSLCDTGIAQMPPPNREVEAPNEDETPLINNGKRQHSPDDTLHLSSYSSNDPTTTKRRRTSTLKALMQFPQTPPTLEKTKRLRKSSFAVEKYALKCTIDSDIRCRKSDSKAKVKPIPICAYCFGDETINQRTNLEEDMISCWDCGTCAHPTCLLWPESLLEKVRTIRWQCLHCKCCSYCGNLSKKDDDMLLCDACDRGFHMYCFNPPIKAPPTGDWICRICSPLLGQTEIVTFLATDNLFSTDCQILTKTKTTLIDNLKRKKSRSRNKIRKRSHQRKPPVEEKIKTLPDVIKEKQTKCPLLDGLSTFFTPTNDRQSRTSSHLVNYNDPGSLIMTKALKTIKKEALEVYEVESDKLRDGELNNTTKLTPNRSAKLENTRYTDGRFMKKADRIDKEIDSSLNVALESSASTPSKNKYYKYVKKADRKEQEIDSSLYDPLETSTPLPPKNKYYKYIKKADRKEQEINNCSNVPQESSTSMPFEKRFYKYIKKADRKEQEIDSSLNIPQESSTPTSKNRYYKYVKKADRIKQEINSPVNPILETSTDTHQMQKTVNKVDRKRRLSKTYVNDVLATPAPKRHRNKVYKYVKKADRIKQEISSPVTNLSEASNEGPQKNKYAKKYSRKEDKKKQGTGGTLNDPQGDSIAELKTNNNSKNARRDSRKPQEISGLTNIPHQVSDNEPPNNHKKRRGPKPKNLEITELEFSSEHECHTLEPITLENSSSTSQNIMSCDPNEISPYPVSDLDKQWYSEIQAQVAELLPASLDAVSDPLEKPEPNANDSLAEHHHVSSDQRFPPRIQIGEYVVDTWYSAPYPSEYARLSVLYICEYCLKHIKSYDIYCLHMGKCTQHLPPGNEIYRSGDISIFEVDGYISKLYCQQLCLLAKLFLDHKTLYYDVEPFIFYVMVIKKNDSCHIIGYFSKEKRSSHKYNLSCIMVLPPYQKFNYGRFLIEFSYLLSREEGESGSPEKPLSTLGRLSYESYWKSKIIPYLMNKDDVTGEFFKHVQFTEPPKGMSITIDRIGSETGINPHDIASTIQSLSINVDLDESDRITIQLDWDKIKLESDKYATRCAKWIPIDTQCLRWAPLIATNESDQNNSDQSPQLSCKVNECAEAGNIGGIEPDSSYIITTTLTLPAKKAASPDPEISESLIIEDEEPVLETCARDMKSIKTSNEGSKVKQPLKQHIGPELSRYCSSGSPMVTRNRGITQKSVLCSLVEETSSTSAQCIDIVKSDSEDNDDDVIVMSPLPPQKVDWRLVGPILETMGEQYASLPGCQCSPAISSHEPSSVPISALECSSVTSPELELEPDSDSDMRLGGQRLPLLILEKYDMSAHAGLSHVQLIDLTGPDMAGSSLHDSDSGSDSPHYPCVPEQTPKIDQEKPAEGIFGDIGFVNRHIFTFGELIDSCK